MRIDFVPSHILSPEFGTPKGHLISDQTPSFWNPAYHAFALPRHQLPGILKIQPKPGHVDMWWMTNFLFCTAGHFDSWPCHDVMHGYTSHGSYHALRVTLFPFVPLYNYSKKGSLPSTSMEPTRESFQRKAVFQETPVPSKKSSPGFFR